MRIFREGLILFMLVFSLAQLSNASVVYSNSALTIGNSVVVNGWNFTLVDISAIQNSATFSISSNGVAACTPYSLGCTLTVGVLTIPNLNVSSFTGVNFSLYNLSLIKNSYHAYIKFSYLNQTITRHQSSLSLRTPLH